MPISKTPRAFDCSPISPTQAKDGLEWATRPAFDQLAAFEDREESIRLLKASLASHMPNVLDNRLKGNYGAALLMSRLSGDCLVRPADTDVGVDLYCETIAEGRPFLHFWLQVKTGEQCKLSANGKTASYSFNIDHLDYYRAQPVPVFAALVPIREWPVRQEPDVYIVDVTTQIIFEAPPNEQGFRTLRSDYCWPAGDRPSIEAFLTHIVPDSTGRLHISKGLIASSPTPTKEYVSSYSKVPVWKFKDEIETQVRRTAAFSVLFSVESSDVETVHGTEFRRRMAKIVEQFGDDPHWENFMARAVSNHADGNFPEAVAMYERACNSIRNDPVVRGQPSWQKLLQDIEQAQELARRQVRLASRIMSDYHGS